MEPEGSTTGERIDPGYAASIALWCQTSWPAGGDAIGVHPARRKSRTGLDASAVLAVDHQGEACDDDEVVSDTGLRQDGGRSLDRSHRHEGRPVVVAALQPSSADGEEGAI